MCVGVSGFLPSFLCVSSRHDSPLWSSLTDSCSPNLLGLLLSKRGTLSLLFSVRWCSRRQNFPSFSALKLFIGKSLPFLFTPIWICAPRFKTVQKESHRTFVSCGQRLDLLHQRAPVEPARGRGYDGGGRFLHGKRRPGGHSSKNGRFVRKKTLICDPAPALTAVPLPPRSTLSTGGLAPASPRPSRSSPKKSWPTVLSRPSPRTPPPPLLRGSLAGVGEIRRCLYRLELVSGLTNTHEGTKKNPAWTYT